MVEVISMKQHGASMKLKVSLKFLSKCDIKVSKDHNIHNFVIVRFKATSDSPRHYSTNKKQIYIAMKKHEFAKDWTFKVNATCDMPEFSVERNCSDNWSDWISLTDENVKEFVKVNIQIDIIKSNSIANKNFHEDEALTDFQLSADDGSVAVHRAYLAAHSDVFRTMFQGQWKETAQGRVELKGVTRQTLQHFKDYMYLGTLPDEGLCPLLLLATQYLVDNLKIECMMKIMQTITAENLNTHLEFAVENEMHELKDSIIKYIPGGFFASACDIKMNVLMSKQESSSSD